MSLEQKNDWEQKIDIKSLELEELTEQLVQMGLPKFRGGQVYSWLHEKRVDSFEQMSNLSAALRQQLAQRYYINSLTIVKKLVSKIDGTQKYLLRLADNNCVEAVLMKYKYGNSVCISTQVGCRMGCKFCASTLAGLVRSLRPSEMLDEIYTLTCDSGQRVSNVVLMGIGEPLDNFDNVMRFLDLVNSPDGMNISMRHISLSTCGLVPKIDELAQRKLQLTLSVSLHAPNDAVRNTIMPVNKAYPSQQLLDACRRYYAATNRRISFEYAMIQGVNDSQEDAKELLRRLKGLPAHFNLIPLNHVEESPLKPSTRGAVAAFQKTLEDGGITATVRRTLGGDIDASCGQLRRKYNKEQEKPKTKSL